MMEQKAIADLITQLEQLDSLDGLGSRGGGQRPVADQVRQLEFVTESPCRSIAVYFAADGTLADIIFDEQVLERKSAGDLEHLLTETIQQAEQNLYTATVEVLCRRQSGSMRADEVSP